MTSPYEGLDPRAYWRSGVADRDPLDPGDLYQRGFAITRKMRIATAGSCFAQHIGRTLKQAGFSIVDAEPAPEWVTDDVAHSFGYRLFSGRYGNIYTARQMLQLVQEIRGDVTPALPVWPMGDRFVDAQRPGVEPHGLPDADAVLAHRATHLAALEQAFRNIDLFVFTFGLTESWVHRDTGTVYPTAPGTIAGTFDPEIFAFKNFTMNEVRQDFVALRRLLMEWNPKLKFLITVSPVPLTATASGKHVEVATTYSKSVLRAACGMLADQFQNVDYFPSYELITSQTARGAYYSGNLRSVTHTGVAAAMGLFLRAHGIAPTNAAHPKRARAETADDAADDLVCEDALLEAFAK